MTVGLESFTSMTADGCAPCAESLASEPQAPPATPSQRPSTAYWAGAIGVEGELTGDGRFIEPNALVWDLPMPLRYVSSDVGEHGGAVVAGRILTATRQGDGSIWATGDFDMGSPDGVEAERQVRERLTNGVSMDLDDVSFEVRVAAELLVDPAVELTTAPPIPGPDGKITVATIKSGDEVRATTSARIRAATIVAIPAFADAQIFSTETAPVVDGAQTPAAELSTDGLPSYAAGIDGELPDGTMCSTDPQSPDYDPGCVAVPPGEPADDVTDDDITASAYAGKPGSAAHLIAWYLTGEGAAKIRWGTPGDFARCVRIADNHMPKELAKGFCFTGDTEFLTRDGVTTFADAVGTDQFVLTNSFTRKSPVRRDGHWVQAPVRSYGEQRVLSVNLKRGRLRKTIRATPEHVWFASTEGRSSNRLSMSEVTTADLLPGMSLGSLMPKNVVLRTTPSPFGIAAGAVFGDGHREPGRGARIDLWGGKVETLLPYFAGCHQSPIKNENGTLGVRVSGMPGSWKDAPSPDDGAPYLLGWLAGYVATDGHVTKLGSVSISSSRREHLEYAAMVANRLGISSFPIGEQTRVGFGTEATDLYKLTFVGQTVPIELLLDSEARARLTEAAPKFTATRWAVESVEDLGEAEEVFCVEVPDTETFALADYIWVHNCANRHHDATGEWPGKGSQHSAIVSSAAPMSPPSAWFSAPSLSAPTALTVTDDGRVFGHLATWNTCHIGMGHAGCITPPHSRAGYAYFRTGTVVTAENAEVPVGHITLDTRHASTSGLSAAGAQAHYENTGSVVADVAAGEDSFGIWIAGALRPGVSASQVRELRASPLSGDWRRVSGNLELVAALAVNVPGFPIPRPAGLVAGGVVQSLVASGMVPPRQVLTPGTDGALSMDDLTYLKRLADRERAEEQALLAAGSLPSATDLARRVRASALSARAHR